MINRAELAHEALREEADGIIRQAGLLALLNEHGHACLVGSVALNLVVKLDIDFVLLVESPDILAAVDRVYHRLLDLPAVREVRISDYREEGGVKIGIDTYPGASGAWSIDIWVTDRPETSGIALAERLCRELLPEHRTVILDIKGVFHQRDLLRDGMSKQIYLAVLDHDVRTVDEFERYLDSQRVGEPG